MKGQIKILYVVATWEVKVEMEMILSAKWINGEFLVVVAADCRWPRRRSAGAAAGAAASKQVLKIILAALFGSRRPRWVPKFFSFIFFSLTFFFSVFYFLSTENWQ